MEGETCNYISKEKTFILSNYKYSDDIFNYMLSVRILEKTDNISKDYFNLWHINLSFKQDFSSSVICQYVLNRGCETTDY